MPSPSVARQSYTITIGSLKQSRCGSYCPVVTAHTVARREPAMCLGLEPPLGPHTLSLSCVQAVSRATLKPSGSAHRGTQATRRHVSAHALLGCLCSGRTDEQVNTHPTPAGDDAVAREAGHQESASLGVSDGLPLTTPIARNQKPYHRCSGDRGFVTRRLFQWAGQQARHAS